MVDVAKLIEDEYGPRIRACERLFEYAKGVTKSWPGRPIEDTPDGLIVTLFSRSLDTFMAAVRLASLGYGAQAAMLNRSLFEDMIDAHWGATDPDTARQRYEDHHQHGRMLLADAARRHPDHYADIELPEFDPAERKKLDDRYGEWGARPWSGINLHKRVGLVEHHWKDDASRRTLRFFHDIAHRENNQTLHVSSASLNANVEVSSDDGQLTVRVGPRLDMLDRALFGRRAPDDLPHPDRAELRARALPTVRPRRRAETLPTPPPGRDVSARCEPRLQRDPRRARSPGR